MWSRIFAAADRLDAVANRVLWGIVGLASLAGIAYCVHLGNELRYHDEWEYLELTQQWLRTGEFGLPGQRAYRPPGFPALLLPFVGVGIPLWFTRAVLFLSLSGSMLLVYRIVARETRPAIGLLAVAWFFTYPVLFYTAGTFYPQTFAGFLLLLGIEGMSRPSPSFQGMVQAGLAFGVAIVTVPTFGPLVFVVLLWALLFRRNASKAQLATFVTLALLPMALWGVRNAMVLGQWTYVSSNSGVNLLLGNSPNTTPDSGVNVDLSYFKMPAGLDELGQNQAYKDEAMRWIRDNPGDWFVLLCRKFIHYFAFEDKLATASESSRLRTLVMWVSYSPLLVVLAFRVFAVRRLPWKPLEMLWIALYVVNGMLTAVYFTRIRFRVPFEPLLIMLLATTVARLMSQRAEAQARPVQPVP